MVDSVDQLSVLVAELEAGPYVSALLSQHKTWSREKITLIHTFVCGFY